MKVFQINSFGNLSTGRIAVDLYYLLRNYGHDGIIAFARNTVPNDVSSIRIGSSLSVAVDGIMTRLTDRAGFFSKRETRRLIEYIEYYNPDIIHLHNLHGYYINIKLLFDYLRERNKPVVWTLHDCWSYTGHCCYYSMAECFKWEKGCVDCPQLRAYPKSFLFDNTSMNYQQKRELFTSVPNLTLVCVSNWLYKEVKRSFLKGVPCEVIHNGIDLSTFKYTESTFREKYQLEDKVIILGVASTWDVRKGLDDFIALSKILDDDYRIVLVGIDKKKNKLPSNIIPIEKTTNVEELVDIYSAADVYFNASVEETFGLTTIEAMACGTPAIVYNTTALPEVIECGIGNIVKKNDILDVKNQIKRIVKQKNNREQVRNAVIKYDKRSAFKKYLQLYERLYGTGKQS